MRFVSSQLLDSHFIPGPIIFCKKISLQQQLRTTCSFREPGNKANCGFSTISSRESFMFSLFRLSSSAFCESIATIVQKFQTSLHVIVCFAGAATYMGARRYEISLRVEHENRNSISASNYVLFCLSYKHSSPLLRRKADFINE